MDQGATSLEIDHYIHILENCNGRRHSSFLSEKDLGRAGIKRVNPATAKVFFRANDEVLPANYKLKLPSHAKGIDAGARVFSQAI